MNTDQLEQLIDKVIGECITLSTELIKESLDAISDNHSKFLYIEDVLADWATRKLNEDANLLDVLKALHLAIPVITPAIPNDRTRFADEATYTQQYYEDLADKMAFKLKADTMSKFPDEVADVEEILVIIKNSFMDNIKTDPASILPCITGITNFLESIAPAVMAS